MNQNTRANKVLDRLQHAVGLTDDGRNALLQLANPFTDFEFRKVGYPDSVESNSVIQAVRRSTTISKPASVSSGTWDCNIFSLPIANNTAVTNAPAGGCYAGHNLYMTLSGGSGCGNVGPVTVIRGASGAQLNPTNYGGATTDFFSAALALGTEFSTGNSRVIGMGFEVHNTTAELYRQGAVCTYRAPVNNMLDRTARQMLLWTGATPTPTTVLSGGATSQFSMDDVPGLLADAMLLAGSRQWEAADGAMIVPTLISGDVPVTRSESCDLVILGSGTQSMTMPFYVSGTEDIVFRWACGRQCIFERSNVVGYEGAYTRDTSPQKFTNFNVGGAFFSGLSLETTLTVNVIYYVERFPTSKDTDLVVLANPSPKFDPAFWPLYAACMREMPTGVKVADNADGDWFYELVSNASKFLKPAFMSLGGPWGAAGTALAGAAENWSDRKLAERNRPNPGTTQSGSSWAKPKPLPPVPKKKKKKPLPKPPPKPKK